MLRLKKRGRAYHYDIHLNGSRYRGSTHADNKDLATVYARKVYDDLYRQKFGVAQTKTTLSDLIEAHIQAKQGHHSDGWLYTNRKLLEKFAAFAHGKDIELAKDVDVGTLEEYKTKLLLTMKPISGKNNFRVISALFNYAVKLKYINENPAKLITPIRGMVKNKQRFLSSEEIEMLFVKVEGQYFADLVKVAVYTGMRRGELVNLEHGDIDIQSGIIHVRNKAGRGFLTKSRKERTVPLHEKLVSILSRKGKGFCFTHGKRQVCPKRLTSNFGAFTHGIGLTGVGLHTLRHTFASHLAMQGVPLFHVARWLGHSTTHVTELYSHLCKGNPGREEINRLSF